MLLAIGAIIASISVLMTFVGNFALAQNITMNTSWIGDVADITDDQYGTNETKLAQSLTIEGLSPQGADDVVIACISFPERC
jgi:hypothetical protein